MGKLDGQTVIVTGASRGIGAEIGARWSTQWRASAARDTRCRGDLPLVPGHAPHGHEATAFSPGPADEPSGGVRGESAGAEAG